VHDDFDQGTAGDSLEGWSLGSSHGLVPTYSNESSITGTQSGKARFIGENYNSTAELKNLGGITTAYFSYYFKIKSLTGTPSRNIKLARLSGGYHDGYVQPIGLTFFETYKNGIYYTYTKVGTEPKTPTKWLGNYADGNWYRAEYYVELSNPPNTPNGRSRLTINGQVMADYTNVITEESGNKMEWLTMPYYVAHDPGGDYELYYDNVVLSKNQARVEICNEHDYKACKTPTIAKITSWTPTKITLDNTTFSANKSYYLYVFDNTGNMINDGELHICKICPKAPIKLQ
jgi:hypothetical protein